MSKVKIEIFDAEGMDVVVQASQLGAFAVREKFDSGSYGVGDGEEDLIANSCRADMLAGSGDVALGFEVSDGPEGMDTVRRS